MYRANTQGKGKHDWVLAMLLATLLAACQGPGGGEGRAELSLGDKAGSSERPIVRRDEPPLHVTFDQVGLRQAPGADAPLVATYPRRATFYFDGEVSDFTTVVHLHGVRYDAPWIRVTAADGFQGWLYVGAIDTTDLYPALQGQLLAVRYQAVLGKQNYALTQRYAQTLLNARSDADLQAAYMQGLRLRDTLLPQINRQLSLGSLPDLDAMEWLEKALPGFVLQLVAEGTQYDLFWNYKYLGEIAARTEGQEDDAFLGLHYRIYNIDSIEYLYPSWFVQTWDYGGHSLLGRGLHYEVLAAADSLFTAGNLFDIPLLEVKRAIVADILGKDVEYWYDSASILAEMDRILAARFALLSQDNLIALQARRRQFENPGQHGIIVNLRQGLGGEL